MAQRVCVMGIPFVALRFSNIMAPEDYQMFPTVWDDPNKRKWNLWGYIDQRDVAQSCFEPAHSWRDHVTV